jgi:hypothetical protein
MIILSVSFTQYRVQIRALAQFLKPYNEFHVFYKKTQIQFISSDYDIIFQLHEFSQ